MPDLADRISRGAVAALDLAPFDDRFSKLSRRVLAGGASRFSRMVADDEPVEFVIPVGLPHERIDYGALVLQHSRAGVVWRDAAGVDHHRGVSIDPDARGTFSALTLGGEQWLRFDLPDAAGPLTFLVPPVSSPLLRSTLIQVLGARPGAPAAEATPMPEPEPEPAPVVVPDPEPEPVPQPVQQLEPEPEPVAEDDPTQVMAPEGAEWADDAWAGAPADDDQATRVHAAIPAPTEDPDAKRVHPIAPPAPEPLVAEPPVVEPPVAEPAPAASDALYRDHLREAPTEVLPTAVREPVGPAAAYAPVSIPAAQAAPATRPGMSLTVRGFLIGFVCALFGGGLALAIRLLAG